MASTDANADRAGPTIRSILDARGGYVCNDHAIVPDELESIQNTVKQWAKRGDIDLILTTGGTGFSLRDVTPEAVRPLMEREAPGLIHLIMTSSLQHTPFAALSRPAAGTIGRTLVITFPGSVKAVKENLDALFNGGVLERAVEYLQGGAEKRNK
ncbi:MoaB/Mog domain-containing protein [Collybia nuda]|uniref:molybdopterin molybdotransferase n=1 Tax=Collybia nuda TaxID=64659 RepID=A0A9P5Y259_9AGAR|nr:MoaB/Mog domain-containing protein [Collybia nuda]